MATKSIKFTVEKLQFEGRKARNARLALNYLAQLFGYTEPDDLINFQSEPDYSPLAGV